MPLRRKTPTQESGGEPDPGSRSRPTAAQAGERREQVVFFLAVFLVLGLAVYTQANLLFWLFGLSVGAAVFAVIHGSLALRWLEAERVPPGRCAAGELLSLQYDLHNRGHLACYSLRIRELEEPAATRASVLPWAWVSRVNGRVTRRVSAQGPAPPRGEHPLGGFEVSTNFPLGLFRRRRVFGQAAVLRVLPALVPIEPEVIRRAAQPRPGPDGVSPRRASGAEGDFYGSRNYRPGDPLRTLDWKRSARLGELMVRELAAPEPSRVAILLDLRGPLTPLLEEEAISLAASLVVRAHASGFRVGLQTVGAVCPAFTTHHALAHRDRLLAGLGRIDLHTGRDDTPPSGRVQREATVVVCVDPPAGGTGPGGVVLRFSRAPSSRSAHGAAQPAVSAATGGGR